MRLRKYSVPVATTVITAALFAFDTYRVSQIPPVPEALPSHRVHRANLRTDTALFPDKTSVEIVDITDRRPDFNRDLPVYPATAENYATWDIHGKKRRTQSDAAMGMIWESWTKGNRRVRMRVRHKGEPRPSWNAQYRIAGKLGDSVGHSHSNSWMEEEQADYVAVEVPASLRHASFWIGNPDGKRAVTLTQLPLVPLIARRLGATSSIAPVRKGDAIPWYQGPKITTTLPQELLPASENLYHYQVQTVNAAGLVNPGGYSGDIVIGNDTATIDLPCGVGKATMRTVAVRVILEPYQWAEFPDVPLSAPKKESPL
ncbi:MAG: hypothetical protein H8F28_00750 [Fibrella sp.]|nr:hypothetical protein [Armatimonadota bacterium]